MPKKKSTKTTIAGIATLIASVAAAVATVANGGSLDIEALVTSVTGALVGLGLIAARDHSVSSKQAGVDRS